MIPSSLLGKVVSHVESYPHQESCGLILKDSNSQLTRVIACTNIQDLRHQEDPSSYPRNSKTAYFIDPKELLSLEKEMRRTGESISVIYHSHIDTDAYFSEEDIRQALCFGEPIFPDVSYLVLSVKNSKVQEMCFYGWDEQSKEFLQLH
jgi:proteasome lid subunit RPN8/RPN11